MGIPSLKSAILYSVNIVNSVMLPKTVGDIE